MRPNLLPRTILLSAGVGRRHHWRETFVPLSVAKDAHLGNFERGDRWRHLVRLQQPYSPVAVITQQLSRSFPLPYRAPKHFLADRYHPVINQSSNGRGSDDNLPAPVESGKRSELRLQKPMRSGPMAAHDPGSEQPQECAPALESSRRTYHHCSHQKSDRGSPCQRQVRNAACPGGSTPALRERCGT